MRSQSTRWGSCSTTGRLNFNWRLVLAPPFVLDYVAAHEVAHLVEMNHSDAFWRVVEKTLPDMERGREWLRVNGRELMVYGLEPLAAARSAAQPAPSVPAEQFAQDIDDRLGRAPRRFFHRLRGRRAARR